MMTRRKRTREEGREGWMDRLDTQVGREGGREGGRE